VKEKTVETILYEQLKQLREFSESEKVKDKPELLIQISVAMADLAKTYLSLYG